MAKYLEARYLLHARRCILLFPTLFDVPTHAACWTPSRRTFPPPPESPPRSHKRAFPIRCLRGRHCTEILAPFQNGAAIFARMPALERPNRSISPRESAAASVCPSPGPAPTLPCPGSLSSSSCRETQPPHPNGVGFQTPSTPCLDAFDFAPVDGDVDLPDCQAFPRVLEGSQPFVTGRRMQRETPTMPYPT